MTTFFKKCVLFCKKETRRHVLVKFAFLLLILAVYAFFVAFKFGAGSGLLITALTWAFFVFCTPVADAGFLLDFPIRLITGMRMMYSEIVVWFIALSVTVYALIFNAQLYDKTLLLNIFYHIISRPYPYWGIILLSGIGTFLSIYFGDELMDVSTHARRKKYQKHMSKYRVIIFVFIIALILVIYNFMLKNLGLKLPL